MYSVTKDAKVLDPKFDKLKMAHKMVLRMYLVTILTKMLLIKVHSVKKMQKVRFKNTFSKKDARKEAKNHVKVGKMRNTIILTHPLP